MCALLIQIKFFLDRKLLSKTWFNSCEMEEECCNDQTAKKTQLIVTAIQTFGKIFTS